MFKDVTTKTNGLVFVPRSFETGGDRSYINKSMASCRIPLQFLFSLHSDNDDESCSENLKKTRKSFYYSPLNKS